ncbi:MAG: quinolinate synthase NadA [Desulfobacteraceae bacterium]|nr:quinolinate synthase NadA [Desulfobacteraceae bacterium]
MKRIDEEIRKMKQDLGGSLVIPAHHYEMDEIVEFADFLGDSYKLAKDCSQTEAEYIVFGGVSFMAEGAALLAKNHQKVLLPDRSAGCPMAKMIDAQSAGKVYDEISKRCDREIIPMVYMNSYADMKAFCGARGGAVCTSSNSVKIVKHYLDAGKSVFFAPDYNLGVNTANALGLKKEELVTVRRDLSLEGGDPATAKMFLWDGFCYVHTRFTTGDVDRLREQYPDIKIIVHPECDASLVDISDHSGSTAMIYNTVRDSPAGTIWGIGTEYRFVERMAKEFTDKTIVPLRESICRDMSKITLDKLAASLRSVSRHAGGEEEGLDCITVPGEYQKDARTALQRMIDIVEAKI